MRWLLVLPLVVILLFQFVEYDNVVKFEGSLPVLAVEKKIEKHCAEPDRQYSTCYYEYLYHIDLGKYQTVVTRPVDLGEMFHVSEVQKNFYIAGNLQRSYAVLKIKKEK